MVTTACFLINIDLWANFSLAKAIPRNLNWAWQKVLKQSKTAQAQLAMHTTKSQNKQEQVAA